MLDRKTEVRRKKMIGGMPKCNLMFSVITISEPELFFLLLQEGMHAKNPLQASFNHSFAPTSVSLGDAKIFQPPPTSVHVGFIFVRQTKKEKMKDSVSRGTSRKNFILWRSILQCDLLLFVENMGSINIEPFFRTEFLGSGNTV